MLPGILLTGAVGISLLTSLSCSLLDRQSSAGPAAAHSLGVFAMHITALLSDSGDVAWCALPVLQVEQILNLRTDLMEAAEKLRRSEAERQTLETDITSLRQQVRGIWQTGPAAAVS